MTTDKQILEISGISVEVVRKEIKNLHLAVYPPNGRVRIAVPHRLEDEAVRLAVVTRLGWIRRQQAVYEKQVRQSEREMVSGESHFVWGIRYKLDVIEVDKPARVSLKSNTIMELQIRPNADSVKRRAVLYDWYRKLLKEQARDLIHKWESLIDVKVIDWGVKRMKTKWGSCNIEQKRIWLNLELAKKPVNCLEYIIVHEMIHFLERHHNERFRDLMEKHLPQWRLLRDELNQAPLAKEDWEY